MIITLKKNTNLTVAETLAKKYKAIILQEPANTLLITSSKLKTTEDADQKYFENLWVAESDIQLANAGFRSEKRNIDINGLKVGGNLNETLLIAGPCSIESEEQIEQSAQFLKSQGIQALRAGSYKPRTTPYGFQGLGKKGLELLVKMREKYGFKIVTEVRDATHVQEVIAHADVVQIGAKAMYDHGILRACGNSIKPVLLKRGFGSTLQDVVQAAEFILSSGNPNVMICERGIRTFETKTRFTLDLCGAVYLKHKTNLPVILDPSHPMGFAYGVPDLARSCMALGVDGLLIETHPNPKEALSDAAQQLTHDEFADLKNDLTKVGQAVNRKLV